MEISTFLLRPGEVSAPLGNVLPNNAASLVNSVPVARLVLGCTAERAHFVALVATNKSLSPLVRSENSLTFQGVVTCGGFNYEVFDLGQYPWGFKDIPGDPFYGQRQFCAFLGIQPFSTPLRRVGNCCALSSTLFLLLRLGMIQAGRLWAGPSRSASSGSSSVLPVSAPLDNGLPYTAPQQRIGGLEGAPLSHGSSGSQQDGPSSLPFSGPD